ncbi:uncharacterized protein N7479_000099 [Penicillium vulpinum]|uniref:uncharacterized protein n=1 Tax=Penicillium vulpinum TaxID=29845 RepID=UPI0025497B87|nr:uncharacterized protein N7479_000099 [Penicillium vulpinum]KAJ5970181.1 hypothetical protein N7479_000099 [Penicillium vulpinum]
MAPMQSMQLITLSSTERWYIQRVKIHSQPTNQASLFDWAVTSALSLLVETLSILPSEIIDKKDISCFVNLLVCLGCKIEHENSADSLPLLYNDCIPGLHGSHFGEGALHLPIAYSIRGTVHGDLGFHSLQGRLTLLLNAGCDPNLRDKNGCTVSDFARSSPRTWLQWCLAVGKNQG